MSTPASYDALSSALFAKTRRAVLALLLVNEKESFYLREIARRARAGLGAVQRELGRLTKAGILRRVARGRQIYFQANVECPIFPELRRILIKTAGVAEILRKALHPMRSRIRLAFIYGSVARGQSRSNSDVDVCIVGDLTFSEAVSALSAAQDLVGREINPTVYPWAEFSRRLATKDHFLYTLLRGDKIFLIGDDREFAGLAGKRLAVSSPDQFSGNRRPARPHRSGSRRRADPVAQRRLAARNRL